MAEQTPGPFHIHSNDREIVIHTDYADKAGQHHHFHVATIERSQGAFMPHVDWDAYAQMLAASFDLYEALKMMVRTPLGDAVELVRVHKQARAALSKATPDTPDTGEQ